MRFSLIVSNMIQKSNMRRSGSSSNTNRTSRRRGDTMTEQIQLGDLVLLTIKDVYQKQFGKQKLGIITKIEEDMNGSNDPKIYLKWLTEDSVFPRNTYWSQQSIIRDIPGRMFQFQIIR